MEEIKWRKKKKCKKQKKKNQYKPTATVPGGTCSTWIHPPSHASTARDEPPHNWICGTNPMFMQFVFMDKAQFRSSLIARIRSCLSLEKFIDRLGSSSSFAKVDNYKTKRYVSNFGMSLTYFGIFF